MALVTRYFDVSGAGAADGTTWADRAALFSSGNWSSVITGFAFNGSDSLESRVGPGTYSCGQNLASGLFTNAPTIKNPLIVRACQSGGAILQPPDPSWTAARPGWDESAMPLIQVTSNTPAVSLTQCVLRLLKFTGSANTTVHLLNAADLQWLIVEGSGSGGTPLDFVNACSRIFNCIVRLSHTSYRAGVRLATGDTASGLRVEGNPSATSGNRDGITVAAAADISDVCSFGHVGDGLEYTSTTAGQRLRMDGVVIHGNGGHGVNYSGSITTPTVFSRLSRAMLTGNGGYGVTDAAARTLLASIRARNNTSGNFNGLANMPTDFHVDESSGSDADEYVDPANATLALRDFRVKATSAVWGKGFGIEDELPTPEAIAQAVWEYEGRSLTG